MTLPTQVIALLPEYILTITGVLLMLIEPLLKPGASRKPLGWLAILGTAATGFISWYQLTTSKATHRMPASTSRSSSSARSA
jgi:NADH-quinone oxidoreductase subunit N